MTLATRLDQESESETLTQTIRANMPKQYHDFSDLRIAGQRAWCTALWGPGNEKRVIKIDRPVDNLSSPRTLRSIAKGYTTENDISTLAQAPNKEAHNIVDLVDYKELDDGGFISVERSFGARSLDDRLKESPLSEQEFTTVFKGTLEAVRYAMNELGIYHRDLSNHNTLIEESNGKVKDIRLTDWTNAGNKKDTTPKAIPTSGRHWFTDPLLIKAFTGQEGTYNPGSEMYSIGVGMLSSLLGKYSFEYDPDTNYAVDTQTGESLVDENGRIITKKHEQVVKKAVKSLPRNIRRKYGKIINKLLTLDQTKRYNSIDDLIEDFNSVSEGGLLGKLNKIKGKIIAGAIIGSTLALGIAGPYAYNEIKSRDTQHQAELKSKEKYVVTTDWDGYKLDVSNNVVETDATVNLFRNKEYIKTFTEKDNYIPVEKGDKISISLSVKDLPWPVPKGELSRHSPSFNGKTYIEGREGKTFSVWSAMHNTANMSWEAGYNIGGFYEEIEIPQDIEDGTYVLVTELYAPERPSGADNYQDQIRFETPGKVVTRKRMPILVGTPEQDLEAGRFTFESLGGRGELSLKHLKERYEAKRFEADLEVNVFERKEDTSGHHYEKISVKDSSSIDEKYAYPSYFSLFPKPKKDEIAIAQLVARSKTGKVLYHTYIPMKATMPFADLPRSDQKLREQIFWDYNLPDKSFSEDLIELDKSLYEKSDN